MKSHECGGVKICTDCNIEKSIFDFGTNCKSSDGRLGQCKDCRKLKRQKLKDTNPEAYHRQLEANRLIKQRLGKEHLAASKKAWDERNAEHVKEYKEMEYSRNKEYYITKSKEYRTNNPEKVLEAVKNWQLRNKEAHKIIKNMANRKRKQIMRKANVRWSNDDAINALYDEAKRLTEETGILHVVDHKIPYVNDLVTGLHVENNLQILTNSDNCKKGNRFAHDMT